MKYKPSPLFAAILFCLLFWWIIISLANANEYYMQVGFGTHDTEYDDWKAENFLGNAVIGHRWDNEFYIELNHISSVQEDDEGLNVLFFGLRRKWEY